MIKEYNTEIHFTYRCDNNCIFCSVKRNLHKEQSTQTIKKGILLAKGCKRLIISGGEPTLRKDFLNLIKYARKYHNLIMVETCGTKKDVLINAIKKGYIDEIRIPFHAHNSRLYEKITKNKKSFIRVYQLLEELKKFKLKIYTNTVINKINLNKLPEIVKLIENKFLWIDKIQLSYIRFYKFSHSKDIIIPMEKIKVRFLNV
jgi:MoaA/NifB/PqqE/SkfB family radical SAM enzyme